MRTHQTGTPAAAPQPGARSSALSRRSFLAVAGGAAVTATLPWGAAAASAADSTTIRWTTGPSSPVARHEAFGQVVRGSFYLFGGYHPGDSTYTPSTRVDRFDPVAGTWSRRRDLPVGLTHAGCATDGATIWFAGGYPPQSDGSGQVFATTRVWAYDVASDRYSALPALPVGRGGGGLALVNRTLHFFGGSTSRRTDTGSHFKLDLDHGDRWVTGASLPTPRNHLGAVTLGGKVYAVGGQSGQDASATYRANVDVYDPSRGRWTSAAPLPRARSHNNASTFVHDGGIVVIGGELSYERSTTDVLRYDPSSNRWTNLSPLPKGRDAGVAGHTNGHYYHLTGSQSATTYVGTAG